MSRKPQRELMPVEELLRSTWRNYVRKCWWAVAFCALVLVVSMAMIAMLLLRLPFSGGEWGMVAFCAFLTIMAFQALQERGTPSRAARAHMLHAWAMGLRFNLCSEDLEEYGEDIQKLLAGNLSAREEASLFIDLVRQTAHLKRVELTTTGDDEAS